MYYKSITFSGGGGTTLDRSDPVSQLSPRFKWGITKQHVRNKAPNSAHTLKTLKTTKNQAAKPKYLFSLAGLLFVSANMVDCKVHSKCACTHIEPTVHPTHCGRNVWLRALRRNPRAPLFGATVSPSSSPPLSIPSTGRGRLGLLTSVADGFLRGTPTRCDTLNGY